MARGGFRPGAGRPKKGELPVMAEVKAEARKARMTPLEYMLSVMNDTEADAGRRDRMAVAAAPFVHARAEAAEPSKKAQRQANAERSASSGRFATPAGPKLVVSN